MCLVDCLRNNRCWCRSNDDSFSVLFHSSYESLTLRIVRRLNTHTNSNNEPALFGRIAWFFSHPNYYQYSQWKNSTITYNSLENRHEGPWIHKAEGQTEPDSLPIKCLLESNMYGLATRCWAWCRWFRWGLYVGLITTASGYYHGAAFRLFVVSLTQYAICFAGRRRQSSQLHCHAVWDWWWK